MIDWLKKKWEEFRHNHVLMMAVCCVAPLLLAGILYLAGVGGAWLSYVVLFGCVLSHVLMMHFCKDKQHH